MENKMALPNVFIPAMEQAKSKKVRKSVDSTKRIFHFGKYKGKNINETIQSDPTYVDWLNRNCRTFKLTPDQQELLANYLSKYDKYINHQQ